MSTSEARRSDRQRYWSPRWSYKRRPTRVHRSTPLQKYLATNWGLQSHERPPKKQRCTDAADDCSLIKMSAEIMGHILDYLVGGEDDLPSLLALDQTCLTFHNLFGSDGVWETLFPGYDARGEKEFKDQMNSNASFREQIFHMRGLHLSRRWQCGKKRGYDLGYINIVLTHLGGLDGVRRIAMMLLRFQPMGAPLKFLSDPRGGGTSNVSFDLRDDAVECLTEVIQGHMVEKLEKAILIVCEHHNPDQGYPEIRPKDLCLVDRLSGASFVDWENGEHRTDEFRWLHLTERRSFSDFCAKDKVLAKDARFKMARALAYRAGIVKMSEEAFYLVASEVLHRIFGLIIDASVQHDAWFSPSESHEDSATHEDPILADSVQDRDDRRPTIIPRHINDAAVRCGMKPLLGCGMIDYEWAPKRNDTREEELSDAMRLSGVQLHKLGQSREDSGDTTDKREDSFGRHEDDSDISTDSNYELEESSEDDDDESEGSMIIDFS